MLKVFDRGLVMYRTGWLALKISIWREDEKALLEPQTMNESSLVWF
jgi:hypothetical protein